MSHSLGLTLYNLRTPGPVGPSHARSVRPSGRVFWLHAPSPDSLRPLTALAQRLVRAEGISVVVTGPADLTDPMLAGVIMDLPPHDTPLAAKEFLDHWRPEAGVIGDGELRPALIHAACERGIPMLMVEGRAPYIMRGREGWWPGLVRGLLSEFRTILAVDEPAARSFRKAGALPASVETVGRMELPSAALPCTEAERADLSRALASRPVWLAACLPEEEETQVIEAHRALLRLSHRLLLIVVPETSDRAAPLAERMEKIEGWVVSQRSADEEPDAETQVYVVDNAAEYGLWYRLAPVTYLGGSLSSSGCRVNPLAPAALGSAMIHGPRNGQWGSIVGRMAAAQAGALVGSTSDLAETLAELLAPDRAARLAQAAWLVATEGAEVTERIISILRGYAAPQG